MAKALLIVTGVALLLSLAVAIKVFAAPYSDSGIANLRVLQGSEESL